MAREKVTFEKNKKVCVYVDKDIDKTGKKIIKIVKNVYNEMKRVLICRIFCRAKKREGK